MNGNVAQRRFAIVVLATVVAGLVAFVGACALFDSTDWLESKEFGDEMIGDGPLAPPDWFPDSTKIAFYWWRGSYLANAISNDAKLHRFVIEGQREEIYPSISPDGTRMVFGTLRHEGDDENVEIGISTLDGTEYSRLTRSRGRQYGPKWSPDGSQLAFISSYRTRESPYSRSYSLFTIMANGSGPRQLVDSVQAGPFVWSPDGQRIAFSGYENVNRGEWKGDDYIYIVNRNGTNLIRLAKASSPPAWSPDGSSIAFLEGGYRDSVFIINPDGSRLRKLADIYPDSLEDRRLYPFPYLSWSPDGSEILLQDYPFMRIKVDDTESPKGKASYAVFAGPKDWTTAYASWSPDGSRIAITVEGIDGSQPNNGDAILLTMDGDGSDRQVLARLDDEYEPYAVPNEPWEGEWVWHSP